MTTQAQPTSDHFFDPDQLADPVGLWAELRDSAPVCPVMRRGLTDLDFIAVTRHEDIMTALRDPDTFSTRISRRFAGGISPYEDSHEVKEIMKDACPYVDALSFAEGEVHAKHRRMVMRGFTARRTKLLEGVVERICDDILDSVPIGEEIDFWPTVCNTLPIRLMAEVIGVAPEDTPRMKVWADAQVSRLNGQASEDQVEAQHLAHIMVEFHQYILAQIEARKQSPRDDFLTDLVQNSDGVSLVELVYVVAALLIGGADTTTSLLASLFDHLADNPDKLEQIRADHALIPPLIEEVLRVQAPIKLVYRVTTKETTLGGVDIPENSIVLLMLGSANLDPKVFAEPDDIDDARDDSRHLAFGFGQHLCPGAHLARAEARLLLEKFTARGLGLQREHRAASKHLPNLTFREYTELLLVITSAR